MNILHVTLGFYPAESWGGPVKGTYRTCSELSRRGHSVTVYCTNLLDKKHKIQAGTFERQVNGIRVVYFDTWNFKWWPGTLGPFWMPELPARIRQEIRNFDVVHLHGYRSLIFIPVAGAARSHSVPIVVQPHGMLPVTSNTIFLKRVYDTLLGSMELKDIAALIALEKTEWQHAIGTGIPPERIRIIPNGIDPGLRQSLPPKGFLRERYSIPADRRVILSLGRINKLKGIDMLIDAFAQVQSQGTHLVIAGPDDGMLQEAMELARRPDLKGRITFTGLLSGDDVMAAFRDAELFVLPSRYDAYPQAVIECTLAGTPMVVTDRCQIADLVGGEIGEVVPFEASAFARGIDLLLTNTELHERYEQNTERVLAEQFSISAVADKLESVYQAVIAAKESPRAGLRVLNAQVK